MEQHTKLRPRDSWPVVSVLVLALLWAGCSSQPGGAANGVVGSIGTVLQNPMNWIRTNSGGQVPSGVATAVNDLCREAARQVALRGGIC
ncbi:MAG: hypothetical protein GEEBNDBF_02596 [bacterium]|nr:hypothetical protein [bacterium]